MSRSMDIDITKGRKPYREHFDRSTEEQLKDAKAERMLADIYTPAELVDKKERDVLLVLSNFHNSLHSKYAPGKQALMHAMSLFAREAEDEEDRKERDLLIDAEIQIRKNYEHSTIEEMLEKSFVSLELTDDEKYIRMDAPDKQSIQIFSHEMNRRKKMEEELTPITEETISPTSKTLSDEELLDKNDADAKSLIKFNWKPPIDAICCEECQERFGQPHGPKDRQWDKCIKCKRLNDDLQQQCENILDNEDEDIIGEDEKTKACQIDLKKAPIDEAKAGLHKIEQAYSATSDGTEGNDADIESQIDDIEDVAKDGNPAKGDPHDIKSKDSFGYDKWNNLDTDSDECTKDCYSDNETDEDDEFQNYMTIGRVPHEASSKETKKYASHTPEFFHDTIHKYGLK